MSADIDFMIVDHTGKPIEPEPGPIWLESYEYGERMYVPGWVSHCRGCETCWYRGMPHIIQERLAGPGVMRLEDICR